MSLSLNVIIIKEKRLITSWKIQLKRINIGWWNLIVLWVYYNFPRIEQRRSLSEFEYFH